MVRKAQAAMEFLMTYGWAILVGLTVIGALSYFGVFSFQEMFPEKCELGPGLECVDYHVGESGATLVVQNTLGREIKDMKLSLRRTGEENTVCTSLAGVSIPSGDSATIKCEGKIDLWGKERFEIGTIFKVSDVEFEINGELFTTIQELDEAPALNILYDTVTPSEIMEPTDIVLVPDTEVIPLTDAVPLTDEPLTEETLIEEPAVLPTSDEVLAPDLSPALVSEEDVQTYDTVFFPTYEEYTVPSLTDATFVPKEDLVAEICDNDIDDDFDDYIDCQDADCANDKACPDKETICDDKIDNDKDGLIDCSDVDCIGTKACL